MAAEPKPSIAGTGGGNSDLEAELYRALVPRLREVVGDTPQPWLSALSDRPNPASIDALYARIASTPLTILGDDHGSRAPWDHAIDIFRNSSVAIDCVAIESSETAKLLEFPAGVGRLIGPAVHAKVDTALQEGARILALVPQRELFGPEWTRLREQTPHAMILHEHDSLYWLLGADNRPGLHQWSESEWFAPILHPIEGIERTLALADGDEVFYQDELEERAVEYLTVLAQYFGVPSPVPPTLSTGSTLDTLRETLRDDPLLFREMRDYVLRGESFFLMGNNHVHLGEPTAMHLGEELCHYLRHRQRDHSARNVVDLFYERAIEEAFGFFGSKLFAPAREALDATAIEAARWDEASDEFERRVLHLAHQHEEGLGTDTGMLPALPSLERREFDGLAHLVGYQLGAILFERHGGAPRASEALRDEFLHFPIEELGYFQQYLILRYTL